MCPTSAPGWALTSRVPGYQVRLRPLEGSARQQAGWKFFSGVWRLSEQTQGRRWAQEGAPQTHPWLSGCPKAKLVKDWCSPVDQRKESLEVL